MQEKSPFLQVALEAAEAAAAIIRRYYTADVKVDLKQDRSPVTVADVESEIEIKKRIRQQFPDHSFWGEESGRDLNDSDYLWLIDPIDGTKSFVRGYPFFSTQIALMYKNELILGVSSAAEFGEIAYAEKGQGAVLNGSSINVSEIDRIEDASLSMGNIATLAGSSQWASLSELIQSVYRIRGYGDFYHYHLLAAGKLDLVLESDVNILDIAALSVIIHEAGGLMTDLEGQALNLETRSVLAANSKAMHQHVLSCLNKG